MRKAILALIMFITVITSFAQTPPDIKTREDYLRISRNQKTAAWIMLGGGLFLIGIGGITAFGETLNHKNTSGANAIGVIGFLSTAGSIPMFISAGHNKRKAASLSLNMQNVPVPFQNSRLTVSKQPALSVTIAF